MKTKFKNDEAMITNTDKGNSIVILPTQHNDEKINNLICENNFQTININPTNKFQVAGACEYGNELSGSIKCGEFLE